MTAPRRIIKGATYLITRRCFARMLLLRPSALTNAIFEYALAVTAERYGIQLHAFAVLSNHWHCVLTDPRGKLPKFARDLGSVVARAINASLGRWESFWAPGSYSAVTLESPDDILDKMTYVLANPVAAGLVDRGEKWPGLWSPLGRIGAGSWEVKRPDHFFRKGSGKPETASLELVPPPGFSDVSDLRRRLEEALEERERLAADGRRFLGVRKVLAQKPFSRAARAEPRRGLNPRVACRDKWRRIEALHRLQSFLSDYRAAWRAFKAGDRTAVFPAGTYGLAETYGVSCASAA